MHCRVMGTDKSLSFVAVTEVHGRTFGTWTLLTCTLCYICAFNLDNKPIYLATLLSFVYAFGHFLTEYLIYQTMAISNLTTVGIFAGMMKINPVSHYFNLHYITALILNQITAFCFPPMIQYFMLFVSSCVVVCPQISA